jgi:hypothetical protein
LDFILVLDPGLIGALPYILEELIIEVLITQNLKVFVFLGGSSDLAGIEEGKTIDCKKSLISCQQVTLGQSG